MNNGNGKKEEKRSYLYKSETTGMLVIDIGIAMASQNLTYYTLALNENDYFGLIVPVWIVDNRKSMDIFPSVNLIADEKFDPNSDLVNKIQTTIDEFVHSSSIVIASREVG